MLFGKSVFNSQVFFLSRFSRPKSVLILGGGSGRLLSALILQSMPEHIWYIDLSEKMIQKARERIARDAPSYLDRIDFICGSTKNLPAAPTYDLIITPFVLDCIPHAELDGVMNSLRAVLRPGGCWLFSDFYIPEKGFGRIRAKLITQILYLFFNLVCGLGVWHLADFDARFRKIDLRQVECRYFRAGLLSSKLYVPT